MKAKPKRKPGKKKARAKAATTRRVINVAPFRAGEFDVETLPVTPEPRAGERGPRIAPDQLAATTLQVGGGAKYSVERMVAKGGMGAVYEAKDLHCDRKVAVKVLLTDEVHHAENRRRFVEEARITSRLEHPNIIPVHELGRDTTGNIYYTMKYVKGLTLGDVLNGVREGQQDMIDQFPLGRLLTIFQKTCDAVAFAHSHGVVHRDLKPGNIMLGDYGEVLLLDWGLARRAGAERERPAAGPAPRPPRPARKFVVDDREVTEIIDTIRVDTAETGLRTVDGTVLGTPGFMAPEQVRKGGLIDHRTDIYALGAILYCILTLNSPVKEKDLTRLLKRILTGDFLPPTSFNRPGQARAAGLPHCPDGLVPVVLSDIVMKAMATDAAGRYQSVKEMQQDIEDYQNGLIWHLVLDDDFSSPESLRHWEAVGCKAEIADGEMRMFGGELQMLLFRRDLPADVRIEFECRQEGAYLNDVACLLSAIRSENAWETSISGYAFKYGAYTNTLNVITRRDVRIWSDEASPLTPGRTYKVRAERVGDRLRLFVDSAEIATVVDSEPLTGANRTVVGLLGWIADTRYSRIRIYTLGTPWKSDILDIAERHLHKGHHTTAMDLFQEVIQSYPDRERLERAQRGYDLAAARDQLEKNVALWQEKLARAWPGVPFQLRIDHEGLNLDVPNAGIRDLSPLEGLPLSTLVCWGNEIADLGPLRGMPLKTLNCAGNPVGTLEPLRHVPLSALRCEACRITSLEPVRDMPLALLNCSENDLGPNGLEPLRGKALNWISCLKSGVRSLEPLRGMPLTWIFCDGNEIEDLEPLRGMPLIELSCKGNRIVKLDPLKGSRLNTLRADDNRIESLEPLRGLPISTFSCHSNRIGSLEPLKGMSVSCLLCGNNPLRDIGTFIKNPPKVFCFESDTIPISEMEWIHQTWSRDLRFAAHTRDVEVLLALRRKDVAKLKLLASAFDGHRYLYVPKFLEWQAARELCESLGGHLVTIRNREENDFVASLFPLGGSWFWIGLVVEDGRPRWVTGEPVEYTAFVNVLQEKSAGPRVFSGREWCYDLIPNVHNTFMIEWDESR